MSARPMSRIRERASRLGEKVRRPRQVPLEELEPPRVLSESVSGGDWQSVGREFAEHLVRLGGLRPTDRVLDIGSGTGRIAAPLLEYLNGGSYEGFDVHEEAIEWCTANLTSRNPDFRFQAVPVRSEWFNPWGGESAEKFSFPYEDSEFDFAFGISLFTHLPAEATERYLSEMARALKPGGRWLLTFFLIPDDGVPTASPEWPAPPNWGEPPHFHHRLEGIRINDPDHPERAVAHEESWLYPALERAGLSVNALHRGYWPGRHGLSYQDMLIGESKRDGE
jgi:SAM-dependent methyltransferase